MLESIIKYIKINKSIKKIYIYKIDKKGIDKLKKRKLIKSL